MTKKKNENHLSNNKKLEEVIRQKKIESDALKKLMLSLEKSENTKTN